MSRGNNKGSGQHRKTGDWVKIAQGRAHIDRTMRTGSGVSGYPVNESGSAAYRRLTRKLSRAGR